MFHAKKQTGYSEESSMYGHGDEHTNAANLYSSRFDANLEYAGQLSDGDEEGAA